MNNNSSSYYDYITDLPLDTKKKQSDLEVELIKTLFNKNNHQLPPTIVSIILKESYEPLLVGILFLLFSVSYTDNIIKSIVPTSENLFVFFLFLKLICIMIAFWLMKHFVF